MKTQILQLEPHDDIISARDKMGWSQTSRILLAWPERGRVLTRRLDLELLLRHSQILGAQLALVTHDPDVRYHARRLGIHVFKNVHRAQNTRWKRPNRRKIGRLREPVQARESLAAPRVRSAPFTALSTPARLGFFSVGVFALLSITAVLFPSANISLNPETRTQTITVPVQASAAVERVNLSGLIPIRTVTVVVEGRESLVPTGNVEIPDQRATGEVRFANLTDREITIPANTVVSTPGSSLRFATGRGGRVPAGAGETIELPVTALAPGSRSNLPAGRVNAVEGLLGLSLSVTNPRAIRGGTDHTALSPSSLDRTRLANQLLTTLQESARLEIQSVLETNDLLLTPAPALAETIEEIYDPAGDQPTNRLTLTMRVAFEARIISGEDLQELAEAALDANMPAGYSPGPSTIIIEHKNHPTSQGESTISWEMTASRVLHAQLAEPQAVSAVLGLPPAQAAQRLSTGLPLASPPHIDLVPSWWPRLPLLPFRINIIVVEPN